MNTIALPCTSEFEYLASVLATITSDESDELHKRQALDQLLVRSEIDGYKKSRVKEDRNLLMWRKPGTDLAVYITRVKNGIYNVYVYTHNTRIRTIGIKEL